MAYSEDDAVMNSRVPLGPPKAQLDTRSGTRILPSRVASGE